MARIRALKPDFPQSEKIGKLSRDARLLYIQLWTLVDDEGRTRAASRMLASLLYPFDDDVKDFIDGWLYELEQSNCIKIYRVEGTTYLEIVNWLENQKIDHPTASKIPPFEEQFREISRILAPDKDRIGIEYRESKDSLVNGATAPVDVLVSNTLVERTTGIWNETAAVIGSAKVHAITKTRESLVRQRARDLRCFDYQDPIAGFQALFEKIRGSPFLRGETNGFRATFDWALKEANFTKIMEGNYEKKTGDDRTEKRRF